ncbi:LamB/YcsF family protein [Adlercreutzia sp. ZJ141]|uniref:LamB/YcsF family protein n=1 Tax=Adlercreutzia sp. ZJ141 TaxID=2709406 RepID=UPI0013EE1FF4|nr:5-oxoprolinase subunit PxpA [Adlercreutzia sp. ZJ141]
MDCVDLNSDLGESFGRYTLGLDEQVIPLVSSVNVACGMHAGDPIVMRNTVQRAAAAGTSIGAHPGYPDLQGFGRRDMKLSPDEGYAYVLYQVGAMQAFCRAVGVELAHVKPHGQLYNRCAVDRPFADAVAQAIYDADPQLVVVGLANGQLIEAARTLGMQTAQEFFTDRNYTDEGVLVPRTQENAMIVDEAFAVERVVRVVRDGTIESVNGKTITVQADTICVHGDNAHALQFVQRVREALEIAGIDVRSPGRR